MSMRLEQVVPWGRSMDEYVRMFDLTESEQMSRIVGVGDGPASFNVELNERGGQVISCDPLYAFSADQIRSRVQATHDHLVAAARKNADLFTWGHLKSPEDMGCARLAAMEQFLADFPAGLREFRYFAAALPRLPFPDLEFQLALCSHLLFLYSENLSYDFHLQGVLEMARVAAEVRIFPLLMLGNSASPHLPALREELARRGYFHEVRTVPYEFQKGGNQMLVVRRTASRSSQS
jgi:hypothetical protein